MQPVKLCVLGVPEEILLYLEWIVEYGTAFVQYNLPIVQDKMSLPLMEIDNLKISPAVCRSVFRFLPQPAEILPQL